MPRAAADLEVTDDAAAEEAAADSPAFDIDAFFDLPQVQARLDARDRKIAQEAAKLAVAETLVAMNPTGPPKTLRANVADRFITGSNNPAGNQSPFLKHYRCERLKSDKILEYDMDKLLPLLSGEKPVPTDKNGNDRSIRDVATKRGSFVSFLNGHCYAYTENQVRMLEWMKTQPQSAGGLPDLYEDAGGQLIRCQLCPGIDPFGSIEGFERHMRHTHGVGAAEAQVSAQSGFAQTSPDPFTAPIR